ncbi:MAG: hypothetical protein CMJ78_10870 [Planctomycetaceae bacterium]|nr:hypothetical protein [Planctomycetaceae bacterium]
MRTKVIDEVTAMRIRQYEELGGQPVTFPVPIENIVEGVLGLDFDWDEIEEQPGEQILGGLIAEERKILLNTNQMELFQEKPGLERSTIGHEAGHWDIDIDRTSLNHPTFAGFDCRTEVVFRNAKNSDLLVEVLNRAYHDDRFYKLYKQLTVGQDSPDVKSAVDRYQSSLLMPAWLIHDAATRYDFTNWRDLYDLADEAQVNISNLTVRLQRLDLLYIPEGSKTLYRNRDHFTGQKQLF